MKSAMKTDIGNHREINEDYGISTAIEDSYIYIVADGMGGHLAGEVASKMAIETIISFIENNKNMLDQPVKLINAAVEYANKEIYNKSKDPDFKNMGTTCELLIAKANKAYIGHVGDSRVYLIRDNNIFQITRDHSLINDLVASGSISEDEALKIPQKNIITRALGSEEAISADIHEVDIEKGDFILLCTDGVTGELEDETIRDIIVSAEDLETKVETIIKLSNDAGGYDNSTAILVEKR